MFGLLYHLPGTFVKGRAVELLERFELTDAANRIVKTYSGGMRRRLDLAASLLVAPPVLFLDEPTTGLDPRSRLGMWDVIGGLVADGTTVLLTTQYLEEADQLAKKIVVVDQGRAIATGTADELKAQVGGERLEVTVARGGNLDEVRRILSTHASGEARVDVEHRGVSVPVTNGSRLLAGVVRDLDASNVQLDDLALRRPTLDDVFLALTGHAAEEAPAQPAKPEGRRDRNSEKVAV